MKVAHFSTQFDLVGGIENYLRALLPAQAATGAKVRLYVVSNSAPSVYEGVEVRRLDAPVKIVGRYKFPRGIVREARRALAWADVVNVHVPFATTSVVPLFWPSRTPIVLSCYAHPDHFVSRRRRVQLRLVAWRASGLMALSSGEQQVLAVAGVPASKITLVPSGVSDDLVRARQSQGDRDLLLCVGRLVKYKRHDLVVEACARAGVLPQLRIIGAGGRQHAIEALIEHHGVDPATVVLGRRSNAELHALLGRARTLVSMSTQESLGLVLLEALAAGVRPVASDIPAHRDTLAAAQLTDYLVPVESSAEELAERLVSAYSLAEQPAWHPPSWSQASRAVLAQYENVLAR